VSFSRLALLVATANLLIAGCGARNYEAAVEKVEPDNWIEIRADLFSIVTNTPESAGRRLAHRLSRFIDTLEQFSELEFGLYEPVQVIVFKDDEQFRQFPIPYGVAGLFFPSRDLAMLPANPSSTVVLYHEFVHFLLRETLVTPQWYEEGLAEHLATFRVREDVARIGFIAPFRRWGLVNDKPLSMDFILNLQGYPQKADDRRRFYTDSWLLAHQLNSGRIWNVREIMTSYLTDLSRGGDRVESWERAIGMPLSEFEELRAEHRKSLQKGVLTISELTVPEKPKNWVATKLSAAEAAGRLGDAALVFEEYGLASSFFQRELGAEPGSAHALRGLSKARQLEGRLDEAQALARQALQADGRSALSLEQLGGVLAAQSEQFRGQAGTAGASQALQSARAAFEEALERKPGAGSALLALGRTYLAEGDPQVGLELVTEAMGALSWRAPAHLALGELWLKAGNNERARSELLIVANGAHGGEDAERAKELLEELGDAKD
jgi:tetratricopeptide (TPR) repeat protein